MLRMVEHLVAAALLDDPAVDHKHHLVGHLAGKANSWVTTTRVVPDRASFLITSSTSPTSSGSSAEVGSSNRITRGFSASARAMAIRCCWPPERCRDQASALLRSPTTSSSS